MLGVDCSILAPQSTIQEVGSVKLDTRLGGVHVQDPPASGMTHPGDRQVIFSGEGKGQELALGMGIRLGYTTGARRMRKIRAKILEASQGRHELLALRTFRNSFSDDLDLFGA